MVPIVHTTNDLSPEGWEAFKAGGQTLNSTNEADLGSKATAGKVTDARATGWPRGMVYYPTFKCAADEIGWLQIQYSRLCGEVDFLKNLRRLQYDVSESMVQLKDLYKFKLEEVTKERDFLMAEVARLACHDPQKKYAAPPAAFPRGRWATKAEGGLG